MAYYYLGQMYDVLKRYNEAIEVYLRALEIDNSFAKAYNGLGVAYFNQNRYNEAI